MLLGLQLTGRNNTALNINITVNVTLKLINQSLMSRNSKLQQCEFVKLFLLYTLRCGFQNRDSEVYG